jgi:hypothetical protein
MKNINNNICYLYYILSIKMLYNILIYPSSIKAVLDKIVPLTTNTQYELELKFRSNKIEFEDLITYLKSLVTTRETRENIEFNNTIDTVYSYENEGETYRKIVSSVNTSTQQNKIEYMSKRRITNAEITLRHSYNKQIDYRLSLSFETSVNKNVFDERAVNHIRKRERYSFTLDNSYRIDLTDVTTTLIDGKNVNRKSYEIEIEYLSLPQKLVTLDSKDKYISFSDEFKKSLNILFPNAHTLVSKDYERYNEIFSIIQEHTENKPINIQDKYLPSLRTDDVSNYAVTNKLDGTKYNLFVVVGIDGNIQVLVLLNTNDIWLIYDNVSYKDISLKSKNNIYGLDVEILEGERNKRNLVDVYIFDTIFSQNGRQVQELLHNSRLNSFTDETINKINSLDLSRTNFKSDIIVQKKTFIYDTRLQNSISEIVRYMWTKFNTIENVEEMNDGIIFQPVNTKYAKDTNNPILKWKFPEKVSIDFLIKKSSVSNIYNVYVYNDKLDVLEEFKYRGKVYNLFSESNISDNTIIETKFDINTQQFTVYRYRYDKNRPNAINTATDTFKDMIKPFTLKKILDYLDNKITIEKEEEYKEEKSVFQNSILPCDKQLIEQLFLLQKGSDTDICKLQVSFEAKKYKVGWRATQSIIQEIINILRGLNKSIDRTVLLDCFAYSGCDTITFATGKLAKGERPQKFKSIVSLDADKVNYDTLINNLDVYNRDFFAREPYKRFQNVRTYNVDFFNDYDKIIRDIEPNVIYINKPNITNLKLFLIEIFKLYTQVDLVVIKIYPTIEYKNIGLNYDYKYGVLYVPKCLNVYRKIHNEIKTHLITEYCNKSRILDLGSGKGGDLFKYNSNNNIQMIYLVEPDTNNIKELNERINKLQTSKTHEFDISIINAGSQDTKIITDAILSIQNNTKVDVITSFFSLTFLFQSENLLDQLVNTIDNTLSDNGYFVGTVMDGYRTLDLLKKRNGFINDSCYTIKSLDNIVKAVSNTYNNMIEIDLKGTETATTQREYLVFLDLLEEKLNAKNIRLVNSPYFDDPSIDNILKNYKIDYMPNTEQRLNSLYRYFIFRRSKVEQKTISENIIQILPSLTNYVENSQFTSNVKDINFITDIFDKGEQKIYNEYKYARVGTIGADNNCFFHSLLVSNDFQKYNNLDYSERIVCADELRQRVFKALTPTLFENINYGMISYPKMVTLFYNNLQLLIKRGKIETDNERNASATDNYIKKYLFNKYTTNINFTHRIILIVDRLKELYKNREKQYLEELQQIIFDAGTKARTDAYKNYINSVTEKVDGKYVKDIDNEDIQYISAIIGQQVIIIDEKTNYPIIYTSFNPNS